MRKVIVLGFLALGIIGVGYAKLPVPKTAKKPLKVYDLAYTTYLANNNLPKAFKSAAAAVYYYPNDLAWRQRLAEVAAWSNKPDVSLRQWYYLAKLTKKPTNINQALKLSISMYDHKKTATLYLWQINNNVKNEDAWEGYIKAQETLGDPEAAIATVKSAIKKSPSLFLFQRLMQLYKNTADIKGQFATMQRMKEKYGGSVEASVSLAHTYANYGKFEQAYQELMTVLPRAKPKDTRYWEILANIAWRLNKNKRAMQAYKALYATGKYSQYILIRLVVLAIAYNPKLAVEVAQTGWNKLHDRGFLPFIFVLAPTQQEWGVLKTVFASLLPKDEAAMQNDRVYISAKAQLFLHEKNLYAALNVYRRALRRVPDMIELKVDYLWLLISNQQRSFLKLALHKWEPLLNKHPQLMPSYGVGLQMIGETEGALKIYARQWDKGKHDYEWLLDYSYLLDYADYQYLGRRVRQYAWHDFLAKHKTVTSSNRELYLAYLKLASANVSGDLSQRSFALTAKSFLKDQKLDDVLMAWALTLNHYSLANYVLQRQSNKAKVQPWMRQTIALHNNEKGDMHELLATRVGELPYRDRVLAANRSGNVILAQQLAYRGMKEHPKDSKMYEIFEQTELPAANYVTARLEYRKNGYVTGPWLHLDSKYFVTPRVYLMPMAEIWLPKSQDKSQILVPMSNDKMVGVRVGRRYWRGDMDASLGYRHSLKGLMFGDAGITYQFTHKALWRFRVGYHQNSSASTNLLLAGMQNYGLAGIFYRWTPRDSLDAEISQHYYYTQDRYYLGSEQMFQGRYGHKFKLAYPDWHTDLFVTEHKSWPVKTLRGTGNRLIPAGQTADIYSFMPKNSIEYGVACGYGETYLENYTRAWRTFGNVGLTYNSRTGVGTLLSAGIAGAVFGRDHLAFYGNRSQNQEAYPATDYNVGILYRRYF